MGIHNKHAHAYKACNYEELSANFTFLLDVNKAQKGISGCSSVTAQKIPNQTQAPGETVSTGRTYFF